MACVYFLVSSAAPDVVRYVGATKHDDPSRRLQNHIRGARAPQLPVHRWIRKHLDAGEAIQVVVHASGLSWEDACELEKECIARYREDTGKLTNITAGGEGGAYPRSPETRAKISATMKGMTGLTKSPETRAKISTAMKGITRSPETRAKISAAMRGKKNGSRTISDSQRAAMKAGVERRQFRGVQS